MTPTIHWPLFVWCLFWAMMTTWPVASHAWYPPECCAANDCKPVEAREIGESGSDYTYQGLRIPKAQTRQSPDERYHACVLAQGFGPRQLRCLFRPTPGS
jgi:hypothetical protein